MSKADRIKQILASIVLIVAFGFIFHQLITGWQIIEAFEWDFSPGWLALSIACLCVNFLMNAAVFRWIAGALEQPIKFWTSFYIVFTSQIGRYVPGKIWIFLSQIYLAEKLGIKRAAVASAGIYHLIIGSLSGMVVLAVLLCAGFSQFASPWVYAIGATAMMLIFLFAPSLAEKPLNALLKKAGKSPIQLVIPGKTIVLLMLWLPVAWFFNAAAFAALIKSVTAFDLSMFPAVAAIFIGSYLAGLFAFFIPGGLGVREGLITSLLPVILGVAMPVAGALALLSRLVITLVEIVSFIIARLLGRYYKLV